MRVDVKYLDSLNNLVGELVVNRNLLEQDQESLQKLYADWETFKEQTRERLPLQYPGCSYTFHQSSLCYRFGGNIRYLLLNRTIHNPRMQLHCCHLSIYSTTPNYR
jgi:hypothetical protein